MADTRVIIAEYDAVGGPDTSVMGGDGFQAGPTDAGEFVTAYCGKHSSRRYAAWSKIPWGSKLRETASGEVQVHFRGRWRDLADVTPVSKADIMDYHHKLYGVYELPDRWLFNDFGHMTCYYFKDLDGDRRLDRGSERVHGEFVHTTPPDEAGHAAGLQIVLSESHGCIHVKPPDIDEMVSRGYFKRGNLMVVHDYTDPLPTLPRDPAGKAPFEVHFFPGPKKMLIYGAGTR